MPLVKISEILKKADAQKKAVVAFDCFNYESILCAISAAEKVGSPVIVMYFPGDIPAAAFAGITKALAEKATVDVGCMLDHGPSFEDAMDCIKAGFPSIMIDNSHLPFEENVRLTQEVVRVAHLMGVDVEAELGHVGEANNEADYKDENLYAKPEEVIEFVERTGVDALAVHIGSAHGFYVSEPHLDLERLEAINKVTDVPLVLHGGSGIPFDQVRAAIKLGINKLNIGTQFDKNYATAYQEMLQENPGGRLMFEMTPILVEKTHDYVASLLNMAWGD